MLIHLLTLQSVVPAPAVTSTPLRKPKGPVSVKDDDGEAVDFSESLLPACAVEVKSKGEPKAIAEPATPQGLVNVMMCDFVCVLSHRYTQNCM